MRKPTVEEHFQALRKAVSYEPSTGVFTWVISPARNVRAGQVAGHINKGGYALIDHLGRRARANRLAWYFMTGEIPAGYIDHIDGNPGNNAWGNLRIATPSQNRQNLRAAANTSTTGFLGVAQPSKRSKKWRSQIVVNGKTVYLGCYSTPQEAHQAYLRKKRELHPFGTI